jgi:hypothetical protein
MKLVRRCISCVSVTCMKVFSLRTLGEYALFATSVACCFASTLRAAMWTLWLGCNASCAASCRVVWRAEAVTSGSPAKTMGPASSRVISNSCHFHFMSVSPQPAAAY